MGLSDSEENDGKEESEEEEEEEEEGEEYFSEEGYTSEEDEEVPESNDDKKLEHSSPLLALQTSPSNKNTTEESISTIPSAIPPTIPTFNLSLCSSIEELIALGPERLKIELQQRGLLCGGTVEQRVQRLWSVKGKTLREIDPKLKSKK